MTWPMLMPFLHVADVNNDNRSVFVNVERITAIIEGDDRGMARLFVMGMTPILVNEPMGEVLRRLSEALAPGDT